MRRWVALVLAATALASLSWNGHAAAGDGLGGVLRQMAGIVHRLAAGAWVGAIAAILQLALRPQGLRLRERTHALWQAAHGFALPGTIIVATLAMTGTYTYVDLGGSAQTLTGTAHGRWLLLKLALVTGMLARLQQDFARLTGFSGDLAHELRTPITNMLTQVQVVLAHPRSNEAYRETLASCAEELQQLAQTVGDLLYLAQAEAPGALPSREPVPLDAVADALLEFYEPLAEDRQLTLRREGMARVNGNRLMPHRAIANLLSNALKHAAAGSEVRMRLAEAEGLCRISVHNIGMPIAIEALLRLFDRFYRGERGRHEGAGLGLAITRAIAQAHGGSVSVVSDEAGTVFEMVLPVAQRQAPSTHGVDLL